MLRWTVKRAGLVAARARTQMTMTPTTMAATSRNLNIGTLRLRSGLTPVHKGKPAYASRLFAGLGGHRCRGSDLHRVRRGPGGLSVRQFQAVHGDFHLASIDLDEQVVIVHVLAKHWIPRLAWNHVWSCCPSSGDEVDDTVVFMPLIVVNVPGNHHQTGTDVLLPLFQ